jgi:hypothetical protein
MSQTYTHIGSTYVNICEYIKVFNMKHFRLNTNMNYPTYPIKMAEICANILSKWALLYSTALVDFVIELKPQLKYQES